MLEFFYIILRFRSLSHESTDGDYPSLVNEREKGDRKSGKINIKRPLSPIVLPTTKKVSQMRRLSSSSDVTFASFNGEYNLNRTINILYTE